MPTRKIPLLILALATLGSLYAQEGIPVDPANGLILANEHVRLEFGPGCYGRNALPHPKSN